MHSVYIDFVDTPETPTPQVAKRFGFLCNGRTSHAHLSSCSHSTRKDYSRLSTGARKLYWKKKRASYMSWETLSYGMGGNPFRNPNTADEIPQERGLRYEEMPSYLGFSKWERINDKESRQCYFGPPEMIFCTPPASKNGRTKEDELYDGGYYAAHQRDNQQQHRHRHNEKHREYHHHHQRHRQHGNRHNGQHHPFQPWRKSDNDRLTSVHDEPSRNSNTSHADSRRTDLSVPQLATPISPSLNVDRNGKSLSERPWCEDKPSDLTRWSPKRLLCGKKSNEVTPITCKFSTKPFPRKREEGRRRNSLSSFCSQGKWISSPYLKLNQSERLDYSGKSDFSRSVLLLCISRSTDFCLSHLMHSMRVEKPAKPITISGRPWFERSDSMKGMEVSDKPHAMQMVFFDTITMDETSKEAEF